MTGPLGRVRTAVTAPGRWVDGALPDSRSRTRALRIGAIVAAVLLVAVGVLGVLAVRDSRTAAARADGLAAAAELTPRLLTYDFRSLADEFAGQYGSFADQILSPNAAAQKFQTKATVRNYAVISASTDELVALLFLDQATNSKALTAPRLDNAGVRVTMREVDGKWLVAGMDRL